MRVAISTTRSHNLFERCGKRKSKAFEDRVIERSQVAKAKKDRTIADNLLESEE